MNKAQLQRAVDRAKSWRTGRLGSGSSVLAAGLADLLDRRAQQAGDLHLRGAQPAGDLRLGQVAAEAQEQDQAIGLRQGLDPGGDHAQVLGLLEALILGAEQLARG